MSPMNVNTIGSYIREQREQARISLRQLAQNAGISNPYLSQIERGLRRPSADILQQIARGLRISAEALYVQAGFLEDPDMLHYGGKGHEVRAGEVGHGGFAEGEGSEDGAAGGVGEGAEGGIEGCGILNHMV